MEDLEASIRETAGKLLSEKKVDLVIGYEHGTLPLRTTPCFIDKAEDAHKLVWNSSCDVNLAKYAVGREEKIAVVAKGCDARALAVVALVAQPVLVVVQLVRVGR